MDDLLPDDAVLPSDWTVEFVQLAGYTLTVYCTGPCKSGRTIDPLALAAAGRAKQRISAMRFKCPRCGAKGQPLVSWWAGGYASFDYGRGLLKGELPRPAP